MNNKQKYATVILKGGLGEKIFQIFTTIAYAIKTNKKFCFLFSGYLDVKNTYWDSFLYKLKKYTIMNDTNNYVVFKEKYFEYDELPVLNNNIKLKGYFQSYKYFEKEMNEILRLINFDYISANIIYIHKFFNFTNSISLHFRLGDYKYLQEYHPVLNLIYYIRALHECDKNNNIKNVYYCCEKQDNHDVAIKIDLLQKINPNLNFIKIKDSIPDWKQMIIMSMCDHNIIANSTFSWWSAYLNKNPTKCVYYPETWFGKKLKNDTKDLIPSDWIKIKC